jgi:hypothetical protein
MDISDGKDEKGKYEFYHLNIFPSEEKRVKTIIKKSDTEKFLLFYPVSACAFYTEKCCYY